MKNANGSNGGSGDGSGSGSLRRRLSPDDRSPEESSRDRRRRRIELRRNPAGRVVVRALPSIMARGWHVLDHRSLQHGSTPVEGMPLPLTESARVYTVPVVGAVAVAGRLPEMEDTVTIKTNLCFPTINLGRPVHFFGVFDGHGGPHVSMVCKENMHEIVEEELMEVNYPVFEPNLVENESLLQESWRILMTRSFLRTEQVALSPCPCGRVDYLCNCVQLWSGSTAVVVVLTQEHIITANCGDSRAVLSRGGRLVPLSFDHKPDRADESARIKATGGRILYLDTARVEGILAMSRAIGDRFLKPWVLSEPEVTFTRRDEEDELLIMASDGLWDVMSSEMSCHVARECLNEPSHGLDFAAAEIAALSPVEFPSRSAFAAALLTRLALARGSRDNISVVVIDLKRVVPPPVRVRVTGTSMGKW